MRRLLGLAAIATLGSGCDRVFSIHGGPGDSGDGPRLDAAWLDGPLDDTDGDTVLNGDDNCPMIPNPLQWDEDADGIGDRCDRCIGIPDPGQADTDGDGVGDECDRYPGGPATVTWGSYFVEGGGSPADWRGFHGQWAFGDGAATQTMTVQDTNAVLTAVVPQNGVVWLEIGFASGAVAPTNDNAAGVWVDVNGFVANPADGHYCELHLNGLGSNLQLWRRAGGADQGVISQQPASEIITDPLIHIQGISGADYGCAEFGVPGFTKADPAGAPIRRFGLHTSYLAGDFTYAIIYYQPP